MYKNRRNCCPECGSVKMQKLTPYGSRRYVCFNGHSFFTGDVMPLFLYKKLSKRKDYCSCHCHKCAEPNRFSEHDCCNKTVNPIKKYKYSKDTFRVYMEKKYGNK